MMKQFKNLRMKHAFWTLFINELNCDVFPLVGGGAAGGVSAGLHAFFGSRIENGFDILSKITDLERKFRKLILCLLGRLL